MKINAIFGGEPQERDVIGEPIREGGLAFYVIQLPSASYYNKRTGAARKKYRGCSRYPKLDLVFG